MDLNTARRSVEGRLRFGDQKQIAAYDHLERVAEIEEILAYVLEGDDTEAHFDALRDALGNHWPELVARMQDRPAQADADTAA